ncbi:hypothetical protein NKG05_02520 [Oerskovia sp. M15]
MTGPVDRFTEPLVRVLGPRSAGALAKLGLETTGTCWATTRAGTGTRASSPTSAVWCSASTSRSWRAWSRRPSGPCARAAARCSRPRSPTASTASPDLLRQGTGALRTHESRSSRVARAVHRRGQRVSGARQLTHPDYLIIGVDADDEESALVEARRPIPLYPASAAIPSWRIQKAVRQVLDPLTEDEVPDPLPGAVREARGFGSRHAALKDVHEPFDTRQWQHGRDRLRYEEAFVLQAALRSGVRGRAPRKRLRGRCSHRASPAPRGLRRVAAVHAHRRAVGDR